MGACAVAQRTVVTLVDDMSGEEGENVQTVEFGFQGVSYEIDLDDENRADLSDFMQTYIANARRTGGRAKRGKAPSAQQGRSREETKAIRDWARKQGIEISDRGRVPGHVVEKYEGNGNA